VDVAGFRHEDLADQSPRPGHDVVITLDMRIQRLADELARPAPAAIVVIDPRNGDVLAMASSPTFNPNDFVPSIPAGRWQALLADPGKPLVNKAILGEYPPGSTFKPVVAIAALENKLASAQTSYECPGYLDLGRTRFRCWTQGRHGLLNMRQAIEHSCNVYFFRLGMQIGEKYIEHMASAIGLGRPTGISLDPEAAGLVPNEAWMRRQFGHGWRMGDTCNLSIGQGALLVTPLQMAMLASVLANGGHVYRPRLVSAVRAADGRLVERFAPEMVNELNWSPAHADVVRGGMRDVIMSPHGTGKLAAIPTVAFAGKTGTAEFGRKGEGRKHAWMIAFAPYEQPRYAVAVMVEEGVSGGVTAAPIMKRLLTGLFPAVGAEGEG
jgi:penicillin-binding protein 2